jgi:hypothetical protein
MGGLVFESINDLPPKMRQQVAVKILAHVKSKPAEQEQKAAKYRNIKVEENGLTFDSKKEYFRYCALMDALREGAIYDLRLQQNFTLVEGYTKSDGERIRPMIYKADFTYRVSGHLHSVPTGASLVDLEYWTRAGADTLIIEDVKTKGTRTRAYIDKMKMMADKGYTIREV